METQEAIKLIRESACPACGPQKLVGAERVSDAYNFTAKLCMCCGRVYEIVYDGDEPTLSISSMPPPITGEYPYRCVFEHPDHKWPVVYNNPNAEPLTELEKIQTDGKEITLADFECCSVWKELKLRGVFAFYEDEQSWYLSFPGTNGPAKYNYQLNYCLGCGTNVP